MVHPAVLTRSWVHAAAASLPHASAEFRGDGPMTGRVAEGGAGIGDGWATALGVEGAGGRALAEPGCCGTGEASVADKGGR